MSEKPKKKSRNKSRKKSQKTSTAAKKWKCASMALAKRRERIFVRGIDADGQIVFEKSFGYDKWFADLHPVVCENDFRHKLGIVKIFLKRYGDDGKLLHDTFHDYSPENGEYIYGECRFPYANPGSATLNDMYIARY